MIRAIWPTTDPVAPAAPETTTTSPSLTRPTSIRPKYAVRPVSPNTLSAAWGSVPAGTGRIARSPSSAIA